MIFNVISRRLLSTAKASTKVAAKPKNEKPKLNFHGSPYMEFVREQMPFHTKEDAQTRVRAIAGQWNSLTDNQKKMYQERFKQKKAESVEKFESLDQEEKNKIAAEQKEARAERKKRKERKEKRHYHDETNHPERPLNSFNLFIKEQFEIGKKKNETIAPVAEYMKKLASQWRELPEEQKQKYHDEAKKNSDAYHSALTEWKSKQKQVEKSV